MEIFKFGLVSLVSLLSLNILASETMVLPIRNVRVIRTTPTITLVPRIKNIQFRGFIKDPSINLVSFLTNPEIEHSFELSSLKPDTQQKFLALQNDIVKNGINFSSQNAINFWEAAGVDTANMDVDQLVAIIMMEVAKNSNDELRELMESMHNNNQQKKKMRESMDNLKALKEKCLRRNCSEFSTADADTLIAKNQNIMDNLTDMSELTQLRLQTYMDKRSKAMETLSNLLKKISDTSSTIVQNMK